MLRAESIARSLGGRKAGRGWVASCPAHDDHEPSLSITDGSNGRVLVCCHAQCSQAEVIAALRARGLWLDKAGGITAAAPEELLIAASERHHDHRTDAALAIWKASRPAERTLVEDYLLSRGLQLPPVPALRFHPGLKHRSGAVWPTMVALITIRPDSAPIAIHRTFLARDGQGKAPVTPPKMMLGPCRGGAVRLGAPSSLLMVGEGIETCLTAMQSTGYPVWAALSTSGLRALELPPKVREVIILADGDDAGEAAARDAALRWRRDGHRARIARPPRGLDFTMSFWADYSPSRRVRHDRRLSRLRRRGHRARGGNLRSARRIGRENSG